jgi:hypothetical protein
MYTTLHFESQDHTLSHKKTHSEGDDSRDWQNARDEMSNNKCEHDKASDYCSL